MNFFFETVLGNITLFFISIYSIIYIYFQYCFKYWERRKVPYIPPSFPLGNSGPLTREIIHFTLHYTHYYDLLKERNLKYAGMYVLNRPIFVVRDPDYIKDILTKDFDYFIDRQIYINEEKDPLSAHLFALRGNRWRNLRNKLTPNYSSAKIKVMFPAIRDIGTSFVNAVKVEAKNDKDINILEFIAKFTTNVICTCAFGLESNTFEDSDSEFTKMLKKIFEFENLTQEIAAFLIGKAPKAASILGLVATRKDVSEYFHQLIAATIQYRKQNNIQRPDFLQSLSDLKDSTENTDNAFTLKQLVAQVFLFFIAGSDTSSSTLLFCLYELSRQPILQEKVQEEIRTVLAKYNGELTYEALFELKYMQQCIDETLRLYPPLVVLERLCVNDYKLRNSEGTIGKDITILIPIFSLQRDPQYYPDPEKFDPERFSPENKRNLHPYLHLPFGDGPRNCIGSRFAIMSTKVGLIQILRNFTLTLSPSTEPFNCIQQSLFLRIDKTIFLKAKKI